MSQYKYSSTQVNLPKHAADIFTNFSKDTIKPRVLHDKKGYGFPDDKHITVLYGIHDDLPSLELQDFVKGYPKFNVRLGRVSLFKGEDFDVIKLGIDCPDFHILNSEFREMMKYTSNFPEYIPHATIAYVKCDTCDHLEGIDTLSGLSFVPDTIQFSNPDGNVIEIPFGRY